MARLWLLCLLFGASSRAQTISASNETSDLASPGTTRFLLNGSHISTQSIELYPLTQTLATLSNSDFDNFNVTGSLVNINPNTIDQIKSGTLAYISCDDSAYPGNLKASNTFALATSNNPAPAAIILYSTSGFHCNYSTTGSNVFDTTFTTVNPMLAAAVEARNNTAAASIYPDLAAVASTSSSSNSSNSSGGTSINAMIILYAITGLITALFLIIIVTGAVRAHRHPERYGPRNIAGRLRQSRARGVARAMLETIPIVKFGDPDPQPIVKPADDLELGTNATESTHDQRSTETTSPAVDEARQDATNDVQDTPRSTDAVVQPATNRPDGTDEQGSLGCSICTDEFSKGQEVRVLPCNHKFHPECVDPWLLNVSGTCPLCRTNLNPEPEEENETETSNDPSATTFHLAPPVPTESSGARLPLSTRLTRGILARRMSHMTSAERLATARELNAEQVGQGQAPRLSERLRDRLRIRTRRQGDESSAPDVPGEVDVAASSHEGLSAATATPEASTQQ